MAELKRTYGSFEAIGILSLYGKTVEEKQESLNKMFELNQQSKNGKLYSRFVISLNCGKDRLSFATISGTEDMGKENGFFAHSKDDFNATRRIPYESRFDEDELADTSFNDYIYVGLERGTNPVTNKAYTIGKKFLSPYDAINYIAQTIGDNQVLHIRGKIDYSVYKGKVQVRKNITSITLAYNNKGQIPTQEEYFSTFKEILLLDINSCPNQEDGGLYPINAYVNIDYLDNKGVRSIVTAPRTIYASKTEIPKWIESIVPKYLRPQSPLDIWVAEIMGHYSYSRVETEDANILELADPVKYPQFADLISMYQDGLVSEDELVGKMVVSNKSKETALFSRPSTIYDKTTEKDVLNIDKQKYKMSDLNFLEVKDEDTLSPSQEAEINQAFSQSVFGKTAPSPLQGTKFGKQAPANVNTSNIGEQESFDITSDDYEEFFKK